ncbi:protein of unknown function [Tsukamurella pulmonis]|uniref:DUF4145 domain-containing protein n=2 Tax=Tsukamurella pulmonis TaxID=47312 RepID=A0A1H1FN80_9ACTN|nr:protein of unknown function [Tsukamurella pulmonis]
MSTGTVEVYHTYDDFRVDAFKDVDNEIIWHPTANSTRAYPDVPEHIASPATEAFECCAAGHLRAAIILARAVIEATAKDKDITTGQLHTKIDALANQGFIRAHIKEAAHEIRNVGNDMAHGDFDDPITRPTADLVIALMEEILNEVYQSPAKVKKLQAARAAANATR